MKNLNMYSKLVQSKLKYYWKENIEFNIDTSYQKDNLMYRTFFYTKGEKYTSWMKIYKKR